jgi:hypothetical protein
MPHFTISKPPSEKSDPAHLALPFSKDKMTIYTLKTDYGLCSPTLGNA